MIGQNTQQVNETIAPLQNVSLCLSALQHAQQRAPHLPGLVVMYGPSGWGKSSASAYAANRHRAYYVQALNVWTKVAMLRAILTEMGIQPARTSCEMVTQAAEQLVLSRRPLIVDEADHVVDKGHIELLRDLYEASGAAILLVGEERLPTKLKRYERVHGRVLQWVPAQAVTLGDAKHLARLYCKGVDVADDLLQVLVERAHGSVRRVSVNLDLVKREAMSAGLVRMDRAEWGTRELYSGEAPQRRV